MTLEILVWIQGSLRPFASFLALASLLPSAHAANDAAGPRLYAIDCGLPKFPGYLN